MKNPKILIIHRRSTYAEMSRNETSDSVARLFLEKDPVVDNIVKAHDAHLNTMAIVKQELESRCLDVIWRHDFSGVIPDDFDLVITLGGDGTVLHASHSIDDTPVLAINSSTHTSVGYFTAGGAREFAEIIDKTLNDNFEITPLFRMEVKLNGEVVNSRVLNDTLFCHDCPASTTRYVLSHSNIQEIQMSSGVWISTAAGSTAAINSAGGKPMRAGSRRLQYRIREAGFLGGEKKCFRPKTTKGFVKKGETFAIRSKSVAARLYIDGPHVVIPVNFGDIITFSGGTAPLNLLGYKNRNNS